MIKTHYRKLLIYLPFILSLISCEKEINVDIPNEETKVVVNGIISPDNGLWVNLSKSIGVWENTIDNIEYISQANIDYYENDQYVKTISNNELGNYYETEFKTVSGNNYQLVINAPNLPPAQVTAHVPFPVEITTIDTSSLLINTFQDYYQGSLVTFNTYKFSCDLLFDDPQDESNFYMLEVEYSDTGSYKTANLVCEDIALNENIASYLGIVAISDETFNGKTKSVKFNFNIVLPLNSETSINVILYHIEEDYFKYMKTYSQYIDNLGEALVFEPIFPYSNVTGGYGVLAGVASSLVSFDFQF